MFFQSVAVLAASLATANAHIIMGMPVPYSADKIDSAPITAEQFPCKANLGFTVTQMNTMAAGSKQTIKWNGTAVHEQGACQLSITTDVPPTKNSVFKVIKSYEGTACPTPNGSSDFTLPDIVPTGKATFVWTWFSKLSGGPELYMNCAPIDVTGGSSDKSKFNALPDMLVANIASTTCKSPPNHALKFPNPGAVLEQAGSPDDIQPPTGDCGSSTGSSTTPAQPSSPSNGQPSAPASAPAGVPSAAPSSASAGVPSATPSSAPAAKPSAAPSGPGGVFAPGASSAAGTSTTLVTVTAPSQAKPTEPSSPSVSAPAMPSGTGTTTPSSPSSGNTCATNGAVVCNGEKQFGLCNNGKVVWQDVAVGTSCVNGVISKRGFNGRIARPRL